MPGPSVTKDSRGTETFCFWSSAGDSVSHMPTTPSARSQSGEKQKRRVAPPNHSDLFVWWTPAARRSSSVTFADAPGKESGMNTASLRSVIAGLAALLTVALLPSPAGAAQGTTGAGNVQVWNASLRLVRCTQDSTCPPGNGEFTTYWKQFFDRAADGSRYPDMPDVFVLHEAPKQKASTVMDIIRARVGGSWTYRHSDQSECSRIADCGNTMIVWRTGKLSFEDVLRWKLNPDGNGCTDFATKRGVAVKLSEDATANKIVIAGVHLYKSDGQDCTEANVQRANWQIENRWPMRPITVLSGDFNKMAHECGMPGSPKCSAPNSEWRSERNSDDSDSHEELACWYKGLGARYETTGDADCSDFSFDQSYYDVIWEHERAKLTHGICASWTFDNVDRDTDQDGGADSCQSDQKRIDFMWVRWENPSGDALEYGTQEVPSDKLVNANTDKGWAWTFDDKYSDHRAMRAQLSW